MCWEPERTEGRGGAMETANAEKGTKKDGERFKDRDSRRGRESPRETGKPGERKIQREGRQSVCRRRALPAP